MKAVSKVLKDKHGVSMSVVSSGGGDDDVLSVTWRPAEKRSSQSQSLPPPPPSVCPRPDGKTTPSRGFGFDLAVLLELGLTPEGERDVLAASLRGPSAPEAAAASAAGKTAFGKTTTPSSLSPETLLYGHGTVAYPDDARPLSDSELERLALYPENSKPLSEEDITAVDEWRPRLTTRRQGGANGKEQEDAGAVLLSGRGASLLSTKLSTEETARRQQQGGGSGGGLPRFGPSPPPTTYVTVSGGGRSRDSRHRSLNEHLLVSNVYICSGTLDGATVQGVLAPHLDDNGGSQSAPRTRRAPFDYHVGSSDSFAAVLYETIGRPPPDDDADAAPLPCSARLANFERSLGRLLKLAGKATYLVVPSARLAAASLRTLSSSSSSSPSSPRWAAGWGPGGSEKTALRRADACAQALEDRYNAGLGDGDDFGGEGSAKAMVKAALLAVGDGVDATLESVHEDAGRYLIKVEFKRQGSGEEEYAGVSLHALQWLGVDKDVDLKRLSRRFLGAKIDEQDLGGTLPPWKVWVVGDDVVLGTRAPEPSGVLEALGLRNVDESARRTWGVLKGEISRDISSESSLRPALVERGLALNAVVDRTAFSLLDVGDGRVGSLAAKDFSDALVVSISKEGPETSALVNSIVKQERWNQAVATKESVSAISKNLYESPELMRYSVFNGLDVFDEMSESKSFGRVVGNLLSSSLSTFVVLPSAKAVSLCDRLLGPRSAPVKYSSSGSAAASSSFKLSSHPFPALADFELDFVKLSAGVKAGSAAHLSVSLVGLGAASDSSSSNDVIVRVDVVNATRTVHHHYDYGKDGHKRTYTMRIVARGDDEKAKGGVVGPGGGTASKEGDTDAAKRMFPILNNGRWTDVTLVRDSDRHLIPYKEIKSLTLIAVLRMGLASPLKKHAYESFLRLPLYEDMAPWNIVLQGKAMEYIDYDTRDVTFDVHVRHAYQVLSVLMNYKRTVEDFNKCGGKANTPYGFGLVSDCVGSTFKGPCDEPERPVPCNTAKGSCQTDFISCLKAIAEEDVD